MPEIQVKGMRCQHCLTAVSKALETLAGVEEVSVDMEKGLARWKDKDPACPLPVEKAQDAVRMAGFEV
ncbi:MAG: cation transporter [Deltaproteobacteria bacterium]|nr:cation transporter [Deltaproteobacteria bacterium]